MAFQQSFSVSGDGSVSLVTGGGVPPRPSASVKSYKLVPQGCPRGFFTFGGKPLLASECTAVAPPPVPPRVVPPHLEFVADRIVHMTEAIRKGACQPSPTYIADVQVDGFNSRWRYKTVAYILEYAEIGATHETLALAVNFFDRFLGKHSIRKGEVELQAAVCVLVASKMIEKDSEAFRIEELAGAVKNVTEQMVKETEMSLISVLDWKLSAVTSVSLMLHLTELFDELVDVKIKKKVVDTAGAFLDHAMCEYEFLQYDCITQACSAILCACYNQRLDDAVVGWKRRALECGVNFHDGSAQVLKIRACSGKLLEAFYKCFPHLRPDARILATAAKASRSSSPQNIQDVPGTVFATVPKSPVPTSRKMAGVPMSPPTISSERYAYPSDAHMPVDGFYC